MGVAVYDCLESTNATLIQNAAQGLGEGAWILAKRQTGGRGRQGRSWESLTGNLHASTLVRLHPDDPPAASLSMVGAIALFRTFIETTDIASARLRIKWPNDLIAKRAGDWFKIAGILLERQDQLIVLGFGVNLAQAPDLPQRKTICAAQFGHVPDPTFFCLALGRHFAVELTCWRQRGLADIGRRWLDRAHPVGTQLTVHTSANETITGSFDGIEPDGALRLTLNDGLIEVVRAGDVEL